MRRLSPALRVGLAVGGKVSREPSLRRMVWDPVFPDWPPAPPRGRMYAVLSEQRDLDGLSECELPDEAVAAGITPLPAAVVAN